MKRKTLFLCLILTFAILLGATACKSNDEGTVETTAEQTTVPTIQETTATETTDTTKTNVSTTGSVETTQLPEPVGPLETEINAAKEDLTAKGWKNIEVVKENPIA